MVGGIWWEGDLEVDGTYLANGFAVRDGVRCACGFVARLEVVGDQSRTEGFDHEVVVVEGCDDDRGGDVGEGSRDVGSRHLGNNDLVFGSGIVVLWSLEIFTDNVSDTE
jgi:hypothetical protein